MKATVTMSLELTLDVKDEMTKQRIEKAAYWLVQPFLEGFTDEFDGCRIADFNLELHDELTKLSNPLVDEETAKLIVLHDDGTETGGTAFVGETLDDFITSLSALDDSKAVYDEANGEWKYSIRLETINKALRECGIMPVTVDEVFIADAKN